MPRSLHAYSPDEIRQRLAEHPAWWLGEDGQLHATFEFHNFTELMMVVNGIALQAQALDHHPDMRLHEWKKLDLSLMTHDQGGVTDLDFDLLARIEALPCLDASRA